ncbi:ABC transporter substrate-binding protein [Rhodococcus sp. NPDC057529]|uniref:ABC transporter substrate-binding protein n=1 Tax=Rhodococcus sp. NPDC057529 TaxID=3346158 RepID=UPI0036705A2B
MKRSFLALGAILSTGMALSACGSDGPEPIVFGQLIGVTGDYAPFTPPAITASEIAIAEINGAGGVLGREVKLVTEDNRSTIDGTVSGFTKLTTASGISVLGSLESDGQVALFDGIAKRRIPNICPSCGTTFLDDRGGDYSFRITASDSDAGLIVAQVTRDAGARKLAMIVQNTEGATGPAEVAAEAFEKTGGHVDFVTIEPGASSYNSEVAQALSGKPDALYVAAGVEAGLPVLREIDRRGYDVPILLSPDLITNDISALPNTEHFEAALTAFDTAGPAYVSFAQRFHAATGHEPEPGMYDANNYDQYILFALAMEAAQSVEGEDVAGKIIEVASGPGTKVHSFAEGKAALARGEDIDFDGASSALDLNEFGNLQSPLLSIMTVRDGAWGGGGGVGVGEVGKVAEWNESWRSVSAR